jgi:hypothetical protein
MTAAILAARPDPRPMAQLTAVAEALLLLSLLWAGFEARTLDGVPGLAQAS